jgi:endonuclease YncB( thermonuclease family)
MWRAVVSASVLFVGSSCSAPAAADQIIGVATVIDGDTIRVNDTRIRLHGIDAPETAQSCTAAGGGTWGCGIEATRELRSALAGREVNCKPVTLDRYGRTVARCFVGPVDIQAEMVRRGLAWAFVKYSRDYLPEEAEARSAHRGIWQADTQTAWDFRATRWAEYDRTAPEGCPIKGNVNKYGDRIYHMPWGRDYAKVKMDPTKGKQWFCSEGEAEKAGWRAAK